MLRRYKFRLLSAGEEILGAAAVGIHHIKGRPADGASAPWLSYDS
jgi:hypothetical protein